MSHLIRVGVLRGGPSSEHEVSLRSGLAVLQAIDKYHGHKYEPHDVVIKKGGLFELDGLPIGIGNLHSKVDLVFNALHGHYGEDGKVQNILDIHGIPYTGSDALSSAIGMNKILSKKVFTDHGIKTPIHREIHSIDIKNDLDVILNDLFKTFVLPGIVKPTSGGSSVGVTVVRDFTEFPAALKKAAEHGHSVILEQYIPGIEATCGVIQGFRGQELYALPPIEIRPAAGFFDYDSKYSGQSREIVPATFSNKIKMQIEELARKIHRAFGLRHYSRSDFIIHPRWGIYALEVNTLPGLTEESLLPKALRAVGSDLHELVGHVLELAL